ncbi:MAG: GldG family protein [Candidatus Cloacimonas sp.]|nr:GldG family protein [Candidatus Cloacimonadota bacterium]
MSTHKTNQSKDIALLTKQQNKKAVATNILVIIGILLLINLISINLFTRIDLSQGKIFSLTKSSKQTIRALPERLVVKAYFTKNLPPQLADSHRYTRDILSEYQAYSKGKIRFEFIDPSDDDIKRQEAQRYQVAPISMRVIEDDKLEIREVFMGLVFQYQGRYESIPFIQNTRGLEYELTSAIKKVTNIGLKKVGIFKVEDSIPQIMQRYPQQQSIYKAVSDMISNNYDLKEVDLVEPIDVNISSLIVTGVQDSLLYDQLYNLDQFLMRGGNLILIQSKIDADLQNGYAYPIASNLFNLLESYGIEINNNIVTDASCGQIQVQRQQGIFSFATPVSYPPFPIINNVNKNNLIVKNLEHLQTIFPSEVLESANPDLSFTPLLMTSDNSGEITGPGFNISFEKYMQQTDLKKMLTSPSKVVAALFEGKIESNYRHLFPDASSPQASDFYYHNDNAKIVVLANSQFITDTGAGQVPNNLTFVLNSVDYIMDDTVLIELRARETVFRPLKELGTGSKKVVRWLNILLPPVILLLFGIIIYRKQIQKRKLIRKIYEQA